MELESSALSQVTREAKTFPVLKNVENVVIWESHAGSTLSVTHPARQFSQS